MNVTTNVKGQIATSKVELRALELGYVPSKPIYDTRYDLILDNGKGLKKIQIKYADGKITNSDGSVRVKLEYKNRKQESFTYTSSEIDGIIIYLPRIDKLCYLPPKIFENKKVLCIRIEPSKNNQSKGILYAKDYFW